MLMRGCNTTKANDFERKASVTHEHYPDEFTCMKNKAGYGTEHHVDRVFEHMSKGSSPSTAKMS